MCFQWPGECPWVTLSLRSSASSTPALLCHLARRHPPVLPRHRVLFLILRRAGAGPRPHEREPDVPAPPVVVAFEPQLAPARVAPKAKDVAAAEEANPGIMKEDHGALPLHLRMLDPEVERVLVRRPLQPAPCRFRGDVVGRDVVVELEEDDLADRPGTGLWHREVLRGDARVGIAVAPPRHQLLGGPAASGRARTTAIAEPGSEGRVMKSRTTGSPRSVVRVSPTICMRSARGPSARIR